MRNPAGQTGDSRSIVPATLERAGVTADVAVTDRRPESFALHVRWESGTAHQAPSPSLPPMPRFTAGGA